MADQKKLPPVTRELIEHLERLYPDRVPDINDSGRQVWIKVGQVQVIRHLKTLLERQNTTVL